MVDVTILKKWRIQRTFQQDALGKVNRIKEISSREYDGLKITDNKLKCENETKISVYNVYRLLDTLFFLNILWHALHASLN